MNNHGISIQSSAEPISSLNWLENQGVLFRPVTVSEQNDFLKQCEVLQEAHDIIAIESGKLPRQKPAVAFMPDKVLVRSLTSSQVEAINEYESHRFAEEAAKIQAGIANVPVHESGERLVHLPELFSGDNSATFDTQVFPENCGKWSDQPQEFWVRKSLAERLVLTNQLLSFAGARLHFIEAFRPFEVQAAMFARRIARTQQAHPLWTDEQIINESRSKTAATPRLASHMGGAAVDIWPCDSSTGKQLDFGHTYPSGGALVAPASPFITKEQWMNRQLLQVATGLAGLTMYPGEDWHVSFGDNLAAINEHNDVDPQYTAMFGPIRDFDRKTGEITAVFDQEKIDTVFATLEGGD